MSHLKDETGKVYGKLTVLCRVPNKNGTKARWLCRCECGKEMEADGDALRQGHVKSCGASIHREGEGNWRFMGYPGKDRLYHVWISMKQRCLNPKNQKYKHYGGRGICICPEWMEYEAFKTWAYANGYDETASYGEKTLDRKDVNGNYEPANCRIVDLCVQNKNRRPFKRSCRRRKISDRNRSG